MGAKSIDEFCKRQGFSRAFYYKLRAAGKGPREMKLDTTGKGGRTAIVRITDEAEDDWQRDREAERKIKGFEASDIALGKHHLSGPWENSIRPSVARDRFFGQLAQKFPVHASSGARH